MVTLNSLGLDMARSVVYGFCAILVPVGYSAILVPVGYNRCQDPYNQPFGLSLLPRYAQGRCVADTGEICLQGEGDQTQDQVKALRERYGGREDETKTVVASTFAHSHQFFLNLLVCNYNVSYPIVFSSVHCKDLLGQKQATVAAHQPGEFPKNSSQNPAHERKGHRVHIREIL